MSVWTGRLLILGGTLFLVGSALVLASGHGGNSTGGSEAIWTIGGLMVYASIPVLVAAAVRELVVGFGSASRLRGGRS
jgi:hypothetical protein